jgi:hypothetical protein
MGRFHRHDDDSVHEQEHEHEHPDGLGHEHGDHGPTPDLGDHSGYQTGTERVQVLERIFDENDHTAAVNPQVTVFETSARTGRGIEAWCAWLLAAHAQRSLNATVI